MVTEGGARSRGERLRRRLLLRGPLVTLFPERQSPPPLPPAGCGAHSQGKLARSCARTRKGWGRQERVGSARDPGAVKSCWLLRAARDPWGSQRSLSRRVCSIPADEEDVPFSWLSCSA